MSENETLVAEEPEPVQPSTVEGEPPVAEAAEEAEPPVADVEAPVAEAEPPIAEPVAEAEPPTTEPVAEGEPPFAPLEPPVTEPVEEAEPPFVPLELPVTEPVEEAEPPFVPLELPVREKRKFPWRLVGAAVTMLAVGAGCAFAVLTPQRTDLPGLRTAPDGRYTFAPLTLPTLAPGQAAPSSTANAGGQHISDIRKLLLSPPQGATPDHSLPGASGWVSRAATVQLLNNPQADQQLTSDGWRHTAGVAWKTPDGADTKIWLVQFIDSTAAGDAYSSLSAFYSLYQPPGSADENITVNATTAASYIRVVKGATATWYGEVQVDDTVLMIEYTAPKSIGLPPFAQELSLQTELLQ